MDYEIAALPKRKPTELSPKPGDRYGFEPATIRFFRPNQQDISTLQHIRDDEEAQKRLEGLAEMTGDDLINWANEDSPSISPKWTNVMLSTTDANGEPAGFVYFYRNHHSRARRATEEDKITEPLNPGDLDLEISVGRDPTNDTKGLISSGIRQGCMKLREIMFSQGKSPDNLGLRIRAYIEPDNDASLRAFQAAGFVIKGNTNYNKDSPNPDLLLEVDWQKLDESFQKKSASEMDHSYSSEMAPSYPSLDSNQLHKV